MSSPFNRSELISRSPPPVRRHPAPEDTTSAQVSPKPSKPPSSEVVTTTELCNWLTRIEHSLNDICSVSSDGGKLNTEHKLRISNQCRSVAGSVSQLVAHYQSLKLKYVSACNHIETLTKEKSISEQLENLSLALKTAPNSADRNISFADVVKTSQNSFVCPPNTASVAIFPADKALPSEETKKLVREIIRPEKLKLHIRGVWNTKNGGVIVSSERKSDLEVLKKSEELKTSGLMVELRTKRRPRIILIGVPAELPVEDVLECIYAQNVVDKDASYERETFFKSIKLSHKSGRKDATHCNLVFEVTAELRKLIIAQNRVYINWTSCPVKDFTLVTRCFKCQQYGHSAKYCRDDDHTCGHCGQTGHSFKECKLRDQPPKCASCLRYKKPSNHSTGDIQCPARKSAEGRYLQSIDYGGA